jgi:hypothetical protein
MKVSTEIDNNFGYEKITQLVDNIPLISVCIKSQVQREITPEIKKIPVDQYKWDQDSVDFYKDASLEKESAEGILYLNSILDDNKFNEY